ncbi:GNAT family N-acetyltransferase [Streptomyces kebangsaanensis]|uniref:GNAT family N-acetyltransferase n=1 Tax=Streptomyces kebangsaanensis TaxID=864058 RepID=UPI00093F9B29|nr:GNAT family N-acetyltransferase [Streptomyces kebangsaanensis]
MSDDCAAVAVWTTPATADAVAVFAEIGPEPDDIAGDRAPFATRAEEVMRPHRPTEPCWFLATVGVDPDQQGRGLGRAVILPGVEAVERAGVPAFLEISAKRNVRFYQGLGFEVTADYALPDGAPRTWAMTRRPGSVSRRSRPQQIPADPSRFFSRTCWSRSG